MEQPLLTVRWLPFSSFEAVLPSIRSRKRPVVNGDYRIFCERVVSVVQPRRLLIHF